VGKRSCENGPASAPAPVVTLTATPTASRVVLEVIVVNRSVALDARRAHLQHDANAPVAIQIKIERKNVGFNQPVAAQQLTHDNPGFGVSEKNPDVESVIVEKNADLNNLGRRLTLIEIPLEEAAGDKRRLPGTLVETAVQRDRPARSHGARGTVVVGGCGSGQSQARKERAWRGKNGQPESREVS
jgi:hypothetical protein